MNTNQTSLIVQVHQRAIALFPQAVMGFGIFLLLFLTATIVFVLIRKLANNLDNDKRDIIYLIARILYITILLTGVVCGLGTAGVNILPLVTGLGLTGFALGFAFKDLLSNILAGMLIILYRPFVCGDQIAVAGYSGKVINIDMRYTTLTSDEKTFLIPNTTLFTNPITILNNE